MKTDVIAWTLEKAAEADSRFYDAQLRRLASLGPNFQTGLFNRDDLAAGYDELKFDPVIARRAIFQALYWIGLEDNPRTEEKRGKIGHERRLRLINGHALPPGQQAIYDRFAEIFGVASDGNVYRYDSADTTAQLIRLIYWYRRVSKEPGFLGARVPHRSGMPLTVRQALWMMADYLVDETESSALNPWGLLTFCRQNPRAIKYQIPWDGATSLLHSDGRLANWKRPIATIDLQGMAYDAFGYLIRLFPDHPDCRLWKQRQEQVQQVTLEAYFRSGETYPCSTLDQSDDGEQRTVDTLTSLPLRVLDSMLIEDLDAAKRNQIVDGMCAMMRSSEFTTSIGYRTVALCHGHVLPFASYWGTWQIWPEHNNQIARGLRRQGRFAEALPAERGTWTIVSAMGLTEFVLLDHESQPCFRLDPGAERTLLSTAAPDIPHGFTGSALIRQLTDPPIGPMPTVEEVGSAVAATVPVRLDTDEGMRLEMAFLAHAGVHQDAPPPIGPAIEETP